MKWMVFDSETNITEAWGRKANPWHPDNYVVARGWQVEGEKIDWAFYPDAKPETKNWLVIPPDVTVLAGHNIKFDILYELVQGNPYIFNFFSRGGKIWDTQLAEYLLQGMKRKFHMNSMDQIIESYGGRKKVDGMKELWNAGIATKDIDPALVTDYLVGTEEEKRDSGDIGNTRLIYLGQVVAAAVQDQMTMIEQRMDSLLATTMMEFHGIKVDLDVARADLIRLNGEFSEAQAELDTYTADIPEEVGFNWGSGTHKSCIIYGGTIKYQKQAPYLDENTGEFARLVTTEKWPLFNKEPRHPDECEFDDSYGEDGRYFYIENASMSDPEAHDRVEQDVNVGGKNKGKPKFKNVKGWGEVKTKYQDHFYDLPGYCDGVALGIDRTKTLDGKGNKLFVTDSDTMENLGNLDIPFLKALGRHTALNKEIGTYYFAIGKDGEHKGMLTCVVPGENIIHHGLNHTSTVTSRLSSSKPNCQNIPRGDKSRVKAMFVSRFGPDGWVAEIDYSQLEVVVMGLLSMDPQLIKDLQAKVDFHCVRVAAREGCTYEEALQWCKDEDDPKYPVWKVYRTECKIFSFQRAYGAGASTIALTANMTKELVEEMIKLEDAKYPGVVRFHTDVEKEINATAEGFRDAERGYRPFRTGQWQSPTGTLYSWRSWDAPKFMRDKGIADTFSPPEIKNYPTQGTGGEIVQMILGKLFRYWANNNFFDHEALLVNTVHDCVWFDFKNREIADRLLPNIKLIMESVPAFLKKEFNWDCPVEFPVDVEIGKDMLTMKHWEPMPELH